MSAAAVVPHVHDGAVHEWFELSYANYLVLPRSLLQEMPHEWQERFAACLYEINAAFDCSGTYAVNLRGEGGRFEHDRLAAYRRPDMDAVNARRKKARK